MNREEFITYLKNPLKLDKKSLPEFNEVLEEFPFFQTGHLLYLKNLHNLDHIRYGTQLKKSAAFINNREVLYRLISLDTGKAEDVTIPGTPKDASVKVEKPEIKEPDKGKEKVVSDKPKPEEKETGPRSREELAKEIRERLAEIQGHKGEKNKPSFSPDSPVSELPEAFPAESGDIIQLDDSQPVEIGLSPDSDITLIDQKSKGQIDLLDLDYPGKEPSVPKSPGPVGPEKKNLNNEEAFRHWEQPHSFTFWLKSIEPPENTIKVQESGASSGKRLYQQNLIDKFIKNSPRILPDTSETKVNEDISKDSVEEKEELFSETLAEI